LDRKKETMLDIVLKDATTQIQEISKIRTLVHLLEYRAEATPNQVAFNFVKHNLSSVEEITYKELAIGAKKIAGHLLQNELKSKPVILFYPPGLDFIIAFFGCIYSGAIAVPLPPPKVRTIEKLSQTIIDAGAKAILGNEQISKSRRFFSNELNHLLWIQTDEILSQNLNKNKIISLFEYPKPEDIVFLQYTSGSTGDPKGVIATHDTILYNQKMIKNAFSHDSSTTVVGWLPHFHDQGLIGNILQSLYLGVKCYLLSPIEVFQNPFLWLKAITQWAVTTSGGPNFGYDLCVDKITNEQKKELDLSRWSIAFNGAEPISSETINRFSDYFSDCGFKKEAFYPTYGMAETMLLASGGLMRSPPVLLNLEKEAYQKNQIKLSTNKDSKVIVGCGKTVLEQLIIIVDIHSYTRVPTYNIGEIWIAGPNISPGYWQKPKETEKTFHAKIVGNDMVFLRTGDLGFLDNTGELYITGRLKDVLVINGKNFYPQDLEACAEKATAQVIKHGVAAFEVCNENALAQCVIVAESSKRALSHNEFEKISQKIYLAILQEHELAIATIIFLLPRSLPKTSSGKIQRSKIQSKFNNQNLNVLFRKDFGRKRKPIGALQKTDTRQIWSISEIENKLITIWENHIGAKALDKNSIYNYVGGNSLMAIEIAMEIEKEFKLTLQDDIGLTATISVHELALQIQSVLQSKKKLHPTTTNKSWLTLESRPLLNLIATQELGPIDSVALSYYPNHLTSFINHNVPELVSVLSTSWGNVGLLVMPMTGTQLFQDKDAFYDNIYKALNFAAFLNAKTISLTGLLASATQYGAQVQQLINTEFKSKNILITTGHSMTAVAVLLHLEHLLNANQRGIEEESVGILGIGSIGQSFIRLLLSKNSHPRRLILCDVPQMQTKLEIFIKEIQNHYHFTGEITLLFSNNNPPIRFYEATSIIGATNKPNLLEVKKLNDGTLIVDDSYPNCVDLNEVSLRKTIIVKQGGNFILPESVQEVRYILPSISETSLPKIFVDRKPNELTSCIFAGLATYIATNEAPPLVGIPKDADLNSSYNFIKKLNIGVF